MKTPQLTSPATIGDCIVDESSSGAALKKALDDFADLCAGCSGIQPDPSFDAWADDSHLPSGVAINPRAAAQCVLDYQRSVSFIRGVHAAIRTLQGRFTGSPLDILYAGCGPFATLLLPLLGRFSPGELNITLLDIHQRSLDSVERLLHQFDLGDHSVRTVQGDACHYQHEQPLHLVIAETMQKSLEQEPQVAVTANLAPQLAPQGVFIPELIEVELALADLAHENSLPTQQRHPLGLLISLSARSVVPLPTPAQHPANSMQQELWPLDFSVPALANLQQLDAALFTRITVFGPYRLDDYESEITLPLRCHELAPLVAGEQYRVSYQLGSYPKFNFVALEGK